MSDNSGKKKEGATKPVEHPKYTEMIKAAIVALKERNGSSLQAIEKYIKCNYKVGDRAHQYIKQALKRGEVSGKFIHTKGVGAFRIISETRAANLIVWISQTDQKYQMLRGK